MAGERLEAPTLAGAFREGWNAPVRDLAIGILAALPVSLALAVLLALVGPFGTGATTVPVATLQLALALLIAGRLVRRRERR